jgi:periplasmic copper chaperone A
VIHLAPRPVRLCLAVLVMSALPACGSESVGVEVADARLGQPTGPNAALYLTVDSDASDRLVGASTPAAASIEIHETSMDDDGTMTMTPADGFAIDPGATLVLEPGSKHLMLVDVDRLDVGETVEVTLEFEQAGEVEIDAVVVAPQDVMEDGPSTDDHGG